MVVEAVSAGERRGSRRRAPDDDDIPYMSLVVELVHFAVGDGILVLLGPIVSIKEHEIQRETH